VTRARAALTKSLINKGSLEGFDFKEERIQPRGEQKKRPDCPMSNWIIPNTLTLLVPLSSGTLNVYLFEILGDPYAAVLESQLRVPAKCLPWTEGIAISPRFFEPAFAARRSAKPLS
jgi:hypothetical protein